MNETMMQAFAEELESIQKEAGVGDFLRKGVRGIGSLLSGKGGLNVAAKNMGGHKNVVKSIWNKGATRVGASGAPGGTWGGIKSLAKSRYGQMAGAGALGVGGTAYAGSKLLGNRSGPRR